MNKLAIAAIGRDQPGIVAAFTQVLYQHRCNVEDTSMTLLEDHFSMLIILHAPADVAMANLEQALAPVREAFQLQVSLLAIETGQAASLYACNPWMISVSGADQTGITYHVTQYLAAQRINIRHLSSRQVAREDGRVLFLMSVEADVPASLDAETLQADFAALAQRENLEIIAEKLDVYTL